MTSLFPVDTAGRRLTVAALMRAGEEVLAACGLPSPRADAAALAACACGIPYHDLARNLSDDVCAGATARFYEMITRRAGREPLQLITASAPFLDLTLAVRPGVFLPRAETEGLAVLAESLIAGVKEAVVADLFAGVGPLAIYLARRRPDGRVFAVEADEVAVSALAKNVRALDVRVEIIAADLARAGSWPAPPPLDLIVANPPYIPTAALGQLPPEVKDWEPRRALDGGADGLAFYPVIATFAAAHLKAGGYVAAEIDENAAAAVAAIFRPVGQAEVMQDLAGRDRYVVVRKGNVT